MIGKYLNPNNNHPSDIPEEFLDENHMWKVLSWREKAKLTEGQLYAYEQFWDAVVNERVLRQKFYRESKAEGFEKGRAEGFEKGRAEGFEKGIAEGKAEGKAEEKKDIARRLKSLNLLTTDIAHATGLSVAEIEEL